MNHVLKIFYCQIHVWYAYRTAKNPLPVSGKKNPKIGFFTKNAKIYLFLVFYIWQHFKNRKWKIMAIYQMILSRKSPKIAKNCQK